MAYAQATMWIDALDRAEREYDNVLTVAHAWELHPSLTDIGAHMRPLSSDNFSKFNTLRKLLF